MIRMRPLQKTRPNERNNSHEENDGDDQNFMSFVSEVVEPGSEIRLDGWAGYNKLSDVGYMHNKILLCESGDPAHVLMPGVHRISSLVKRWLLGTHQGAIQ